MDGMLSLTIVCVIFAIGDFISDKTNAVVPVLLFASVSFLILFWTGLTLSCLDSLTGWYQWVTVLVAYVCIVYIMFNGAQRLEKRQMARYGDNAEYKAYADQTPIIIPFLPVYHLNKQN